MAKLIARRPVLYMGRTYERGDALPAHDPKMVAAWLRAESAAWNGQKRPQDGDGGQGGQEPTEGGNHVQNSKDAPEEAENGGGSETPAMLTGHLDVADLEKWKKADLEKLAADMGVDISKAKNNAERAAILAAVEVQAPANDHENGGGAQ